MSFFARVGRQAAMAYQRLDLLVDRTIHVPPLCCAVVPHDVTFLTCDVTSQVLLIRRPGTFIDRTLIIDQGPIDSGAVQTAVFNLSNKPVKLKRGDVISHLISVRIE